MWISSLIGFCDFLFIMFLSSVLTVCLGLQIIGFSSMLLLMTTLIFIFIEANRFFLWPLISRLTESFVLISQFLSSTYLLRIPCLTVSLKASWFGQLVFFSRINFEFEEYCFDWFNFVDFWWVLYFFLLNLDSLPCLFLLFLTSFLSLQLPFLCLMLWFMLIGWL